MADFIVSEIKGLREVQENLAKLGGKIQHRVLRKALQAGIDVMGKAVQERTPVKTGLLRSSVGTVVKISDKEQGGMAVVGFGKEGHVARMVEFGHNAKRSEKGQFTKLKGKGKAAAQDATEFIPAHPFMRPAFDASVRQAADTFAETFKAEFEGLK